MEPCFSSRSPRKGKGKLFNPFVASPQAPRAPLGSLGGHLFPIGPPPATHRRFLMLSWVIICPFRRKPTRQRPPLAPDGRGHWKGQMTGEASHWVSLSGICTAKGAQRARVGAQLRRLIGVPQGEGLLPLLLWKAGRHASEGQADLPAGRRGDPGAILEKWFCLNIFPWAPRPPVSLRLRSHTPHGALSVHF